MFEPFEEANLDTPPPSPPPPSAEPEQPMQQALFFALEDLLALVVPEHEPTEHEPTE